MKPRKYTHRKKSNKKYTAKNRRNKSKRHSGGESYYKCYKVVDDFKNTEAGRNSNAQAQFGDDVEANKFINKIGVKIGTKPGNYILLYYKDLEKEFKNIGRSSPFKQFKTSDLVEVDSTQCMNDIEEYKKVQNELEKNYVNEAEYRHTL